MSDPTDRDPLLDEYLKGDSEISRAYREASEELPPAHLDARILSEARRADAPLPKAPGPFSNRWMVPASVAVMVVAVSIVALLPQTEMYLKDAPEFGRESAMGERKRDRSVVETEVSVPAATMPDATTGSGRLDLEESAQPPSDALAPLNRLQEKQEAEADYPASAPSPERPAMNQAAPQPESALAPAESAGASVMEQSRELSAPVVEDSRLEGLLDEGSARKRTLQSRQAEESKRRAPRIMGGVLRNDDGAVPGSAPAAAAPSSAGKASAMPADAAARLEKMNELIARGDLAAAAAELRTFRNLYPEFEIPPDILSALKAHSP